LAQTAVPGQEPCFDPLPQRRRIEKRFKLRFVFGGVEFALGVVESPKFNSQ
jgi:hypothetical protein